MQRLAGDRGIAYVDTFGISLEAATDRSLVAADGLHASVAQYRRWVERILPVVEDSYPVRARFMPYVQGMHLRRV